MWETISNESKGMKRMPLNKKTYYIALGTGEIMQSATDSPWNFKITATDDEIIQLREYFDQNYSTEWQNFFVHMFLMFNTIMIEKMMLMIKRQKNLQTDL